MLKFVRVFLAALLLVVFSVPYTPDLVEAEEEFPIAGFIGPDGISPASVESTQSFSHISLRLDFTLAANGDADVVVEETIVSWSSTTSGMTWCFTYSGEYWNISARDDIGALTTNQTLSGNTECVQVYFRHLVPYGSTYHFKLYISIGDAAYCSGIYCSFSTQTTVGDNVYKYIKGITVPSNSTVTYYSPTPTRHTGDHYEWETSSFYQSYTVYMNYTTSSTTVVDKLLQGSLPLDNNPFWEKDIYDGYSAANTNDTIWRWGCYMTSAAMIVNYWAREQGVSFRTDPRDLNKALVANNGYDSNHGVRPWQVAEYARTKGVSLYWVETVRTSNYSGLNSLLSSGYPAILGVTNQYGQHYVLVTGRNANGQYLINDPLDATPGLTLAKYNNSYNQVVVFKPSDADPKHVVVSGHSPVELLVTDALGRRAGYNPNTGQYYYEIPGAQYYTQSIAAADGSGTTELSKYVDIPTTVDGNLTITVFGTGSGAYKVNYSAVNINGSSTLTTYAGTASAGSVENITTQYTGTVTIHSLFIPLVRRR